MKDEIFILRSVQSHMGNSLSIVSMNNRAWFIFGKNHPYNFGGVAHSQMRPVPEVAAFENAALLTKICKDEHVLFEPCQ